VCFFLLLFHLSAGLLYFCTQYDIHGRLSGLEGFRAMESVSMANAISVGCFRDMALVCGATAVFHPDLFLVEWGSPAQQTQNLQLGISVWHG
jgi:hypothetical protein